MALLVTSQWARGLPDGDGRQTDSLPSDDADDGAAAVHRRGGLLGDEGHEVAGIVHENQRVARRGRGRALDWQVHAVEVHLHDRGAFVHEAGRGPHNRQSHGECEDARMLAKARGACLPP